MNQQEEREDYYVRSARVESVPFDVEEIFDDRLQSMFRSWSARTESPAGWVVTTFAPALLHFANKPLVSMLPEKAYTERAALWTCVTSGVSTCKSQATGYVLESVMLVKDMLELDHKEVKATKEEAAAAEENCKTPDSVNGSGKKRRSTEQSREDDRRIGVLQGASMAGIRTTLSHPATNANVLCIFDELSSFTSPVSGEADGGMDDKFSLYNCNVNQTIHCSRCATDESV